MFQIDPSWFQVDPWLIVIIILAVVLFIAASIYWGVRAHLRQVSAGREELVGKTAEAKTTLNPKGTVFIQGESWTAISETGRVNPGEEVLITKVDGLKLYVTKKE